MCRKSHQQVRKMSSVHALHSSEAAASALPYLRRNGQVLDVQLWSKAFKIYFLSCSSQYSLPQNGTIKLYKELRCPIDQFELLLFSLGNSEKAQGKAYPICPYCYNHPPDFKGDGGQTHEDPNKSNAEADAEDPDEDDEQVALSYSSSLCMHPSSHKSDIRPLRSVEPWVAMLALIPLASTAPQSMPSAFAPQDAVGS